MTANRGSIFLFIKIVNRKSVKLGNKLLKFSTPSSPLNESKMSTRCASHAGSWYTDSSKSDASWAVEFYPLNFSLLSVCDFTTIFFSKNWVKIFPNLFVKPLCLGQLSRITHYRYQAVSWFKSLRWLCWARGSVVKVIPLFEILPLHWWPAIVELLSIIHSGGLAVLLS